MRRQFWAFSAQSSPLGMAWSQGDRLRSEARLSALTILSLRSRMERLNNKDLHHGKSSKSAGRIPRR